MKEYQDVERHYTTKVHVRTVCELCGAISQDDWKDDRYDAVESVVALKEGNIYPEGGSGTITEVDICPACFNTKLLPWLVSQGAKPHTRDWEHG